MEWPRDEAARSRRGRGTLRIASAPLVAYAAWLVSLQSRWMSPGTWGDAWSGGLWLAAVYVAAAAGLWFGREWARRMSIPLAALPAAVIPLVVLALPAPHRVFESRWDLALAAGGAVALVLLWSAQPADPALAPRRVPAALTAFGIEVAVLAVTGAEGSRFLEPLLDVTQLPGEWILRAMGDCCGWGVVITDYRASRWGGILLSGLPILAIANTVGLIPFVLLARRVRQRIGRRSGQAREVAA